MQHDKVDVIGKQLFMSIKHCIFNLFVPLVKSQISYAVQPIPVTRPFDYMVNNMLNFRSTKII